MTMRHLAVGFLLGLIVGVVSSSTVEGGKFTITKDGAISWLNQACAE